MKMVFGLFRKKDPICGMKQEKEKGLVDEKTGNWFCSQNCKSEFDMRMKAHAKKMQKAGGSCCH